MSINFKSKENIRFGILILIFLILSNMGITQVVDSWINDEYTKIKCFKRAPQTFFWNFKKDYVKPLLPIHCTHVDIEYCKEADQWQCVKCKKLLE